MLTLGDESHADTVEALGDAHHQIADLLHEMPTATAPEVARLGFTGALRRAVESAPGAYTRVTLRLP
jgi:hypothetical protein